MIQRRVSRIATAAVLAAGLAACGGKAKAVDEPGPVGRGGEPTAALYDRLGKRDAIAAVVKDFVEQRVVKDARINRWFKTTDLTDLEAKLVDQICEATGGPCKYTGRDMKTAHAGLGITDPDFAALVDDLRASLDQFQVAAQDQQELLGALAAMHDDIVTAK